jgi:aminomethyltransferase
MVPFAGWEMPIQYPTGIVEEHLAVRNQAGVFDVSHMNRTELTGPAAGEVLRRALTYNVRSMEPGEGHYTLMCNEDGGILDDPYVYRIENERWLFVGNASNAERDVRQLRDHLRAADEAQIDDVQRSTVMLALQGPGAIAIFGSTIDAGVAQTLPKRRCTEIDWEGGRLFVSRTGYTGEDGFELVTDSERGVRLWRLLLAAGVRPIGLGARDTLRLEACLALYGNDIDETTDPFEAGLGWVVSLDDDDFTGKDALVGLKELSPQRRLAPVRALERGVLRPHYAVFHEGQPVATLCSGGHSPTLNAGIGMAYLPSELAEVGTRFDVDVRGRMLPVEVVKRPFYRRPAG